MTRSSVEDRKLEYFGRDPMLDPYPDDDLVDGPIQQKAVSQVRDSLLHRTGYNAYGHNLIGINGEAYVISSLREEISVSDLDA